MAMDVAMGGSTNTILHILAVAIEAGVDFGLDDIDRISRVVPTLSKVAPNGTAHVEDRSEERRVGKERRPRRRLAELRRERRSDDGRADRAQRNKAHRPRPS